MEESQSYSQRAFGPLYWIPFPLGLLAIFYAGLCVQGYWDTGNSDILAMGVFSFSLGVTLVTVDNRSYIVAAVNLVLAALDIVAVVRSGRWPFIYLSFMCIIFAIAAMLPRRKRDRSPVVEQSNS